MRYKVGDTVVLRSGGPPMTVVKVYEPGGVFEPGYETAWFSGKKHEKGHFPENALKAAPDEEPQ